MSIEIPFDRCLLHHHNNHEKEQVKLSGISSLLIEVIIANIIVIPTRYLIGIIVQCFCGQTSAE